MKTTQSTALTVAILSTFLSVESNFAEGVYYTDFNETGSYGTSWASATWWTLNATGTNGTLVAPTGGNIYYTVYDGTQAGTASGCCQLRNPYTSGTASPVVFPGDCLILNTNTKITGKNSGLYFTTQVYLGNTNGTTLTNGNGNANANAIFRMDDPYLSFPGANGNPGLVLNGGNLVPGQGSGYGDVYMGSILASNGSISYLWPGGTIMGATDVRGIVLNATLSGGGTLAICNGTNGEPCVQVYSFSNTNFTGTWLLQSGWLQGVGDGTQDGYNSLGTNSSCAIIVDPNFTPPTGSGSNFFSSTSEVINLTNSSLLDLGGSLMNSAGTLTISNYGKMWMHGNYIFSQVLITNIFNHIGSNLANGTYSYASLTNMFPGNFTGLPSVLTTFGGTITVQPYGTPPAVLAPSVSPQPASTAAFSGNPAEFVSGSLLIYAGAQAPAFQWYTVDATGLIFTPLGNAGQISGATNSTLTISNVSLSPLTNYALVVSNMYGTATSSVVSVTNVYAAPTAIYLDYGSNAIGNGTNGSLTMSGDWNTAGYWWDGNIDGGLPASALAFELPGLPFILVPGSELRTPSGATATNFPGAMLELTGTGVFTLAQAAVATANSTMICKGGPAVNSGSFGEMYFTNLYISGGQIDSGNNGFTIIDGAMSIGPNNAFFYTDNSGTEDRGYQINSTLSGSGMIEVYLYSAASVFETTYSNNLAIMAANNPFNGTWFVRQGALLGAGENSLGTNDIVVGSTGAFESMYNIANPNANLILSNGARMFLHQNDTFSNVDIGGIYLPSGTISYTQLQAIFGASVFPSTWNQLNNSTSNSISGSITVLGTNGNSPSVTGPPNMTLFLGDTAVFTATVAGSPPLSFQWYTVDSTTNIFTPLVDGTYGGVVVAGSTNITLTLSDISMDSATNYVLVVSNLGGVSTSAPPTVLIVNPNTPSSLTLNYNGSGGNGAGGEYSGSDWNQTGYWWDGNLDGGLPAVVLAADLPGAQTGAIPFIIPPGSSARSPAGAIATNFPGNTLEVWGDGNFLDLVHGVDDGNYTCGTLITKQGNTSGSVASTNRGEIWFTNLVMDGGQIYNGDNGVAIFDGQITVNTNATFFTQVNNNPPIDVDDRGFQVNSHLTGPGSIQVEMYANETNVVFQPNFTNGLLLTGTSNTFSGTWNVALGVLLGEGSNSLGTNTITVGPNGALETMYNVNNTNGDLILNGRMYLHQNDTFNNVTVAGFQLPSGTYPYTVLTNYSAACFPAQWAQLYGSTFSTASGSITVAGTNGNLVILTQPQPETLYFGRTANFSVAVSGLSPFSYQWAAGTVGSGGPYTNISGAMGTNLTVANVTTNDGLDYVVIISNSQGSLTSSPATLTVISNPVSSDYASNIVSLAPGNLVAYWRFNETSGTTAYDYAGGFNGVYESAVMNYANGGIQGPQPPAFPGFESTNYAMASTSGLPNSYVQVPALNVDTNNLTIIAWIYPQTYQIGNVGVFFCRAGTTVSGLNYTANAVAGEYTLGYTWNGAQYTWNSGIVPALGQWNMVTLSVTPSNASLYVVNPNGFQAATNAVANAVQNFDGVSEIGNDSFSATGSRAFYGSIDEVAIFNTTFSPNQILAFYGQAAQLPIILTEPSSMSEPAGLTATFNVLAQGAGTLYYQWAAGTTGSGGPYTNLSDGGQISGSSSATLSIQNISSASALDYVVVVTNANGAITSSPAATLTVYPDPTLFTLNYSNNGVGGQIMAGGLDWNSPGYWWDGNEDGGLPASTLAGLPGVPFVVPPGSTLRSPSTGAPATSTFPGAELDLDGNGTFINTGGNVNDTSGILIYKGGPNLLGSSGEIRITNLVINGGQVDTGVNGFVVMDGAINIGPSNAYFYVDNVSAPNDRGFQVNSVISGTGMIQLYLYTSSASFEPTFTNNLNITSSANTFTGPWLVSQGPLLGSGSGSLGTNNIVVGVNGALETLYSIYSPNATLALNGTGRVYLHQNDTFQYVTVNGTNLLAGTYTFAELNSALPANFPSSWAQLNGSTYSTASGTLTVLQPSAATPTLSFSVNPLTLTWSEGVLLEATNLLGPWVGTTNTSPFVVSPTNAQMFFKVGNPLLP